MPFEHDLNTTFWSSSIAQFAMASKKQKRTRLTIQEKLEALEMLGQGLKARKVMDKYNISERAVRYLKKNAEKLAREASEQSQGLDRKTLRMPKFPEIDSIVQDMVISARELREPVTLELIVHFALNAKESLLRSAGLPDEQRIRLSKFFASKGWGLGFVKRHGLRSVPLRDIGENDGGTSSTEGIASVGVEQNNEQEEENGNEATMYKYLKSRPRRSYVLKSEVSEHVLESNTIPMENVTESPVLLVGIPDSASEVKNETELVSDTGRMTSIPVHVLPSLSMSDPNNIDEESPRNTENKSGKSIVDNVDQVSVVTLDVPVALPSAHNLMNSIFTQEN